MTVLRTSIIPSSWRAPTPGFDHPSVTTYLSPFSKNPLYKFPDKPPPYSLRWQRRTITISIPSVQLGDGDPAIMMAFDFERALHIPCDGVYGLHICFLLFWWET